MPISAEQWRVRTGLMNASRNLSSAHRDHAQFSGLCDIPSPPPPSWKGYSAALMLLSLPFLYKIYFVGVAMMMSLSNSEENTFSYHKSVCTGLDTVDSASYNRIHPPAHLPSLYLLLNVTFYAAMVTTVILIEHTRKEKNVGKLIQQLDYLNFHWLSCGPNCELLFDRKTGLTYATLGIEQKPIQCLQRVPSSQGNAKCAGVLFVGVKSFIFQLFTIVVAMLLLLAGDVERNPGPLPGLDMKTLTIELNQAQDKWHAIGIQLGVPPYKLDVIEKEHSTIDRRLIEVLNFWLNGNTEVLCCWWSIIKALKSPTVEKKRLAEELYQKYCETRSDHEDVERKRPRPSSPNLELADPEDSGGKTTVENKGRYHGVFSSCTTSDDFYSSVTKKPRYIFPYLDLNQVSEKQLQILCDEYDKMTRAFQELKNTIKKSMKERNIEVLAILDCISEFKTLEPVYTDISCKEKCIPFRKKLKQLETASVDKVMLTISDYSSFFNYGMIKQIIESIGTEKDKEKLVEYEQKFEKYAQCSVFECPAELKCSTMESELLSFVIKVHHEGFEDCSLSHLRRFINDVAKILQLPVGMLLLESVIPGCIEVTLQVPKISHQDLFPLTHQQEQALSDLRVIKISAGDYQYPHDQDNGGDIDNHKDDRPDDGPSDSGFDTLSTTLKSELSDVMEDIADRYVRNPYEMDFDQLQFGDFTKATKPSKKVKPSRSAILQDITSLHAAAFSGSLHVVKLLVETRNADPSQRDHYGNTALHLAAEGHHLDVLKYFTENLECNPTLFNTFWETPLHIAARKGDLKIVEYLISEQGIDPVCEKDRNILPLHSACVGGNLDVVNYLVKEMHKYILDYTQITGYKTKVGITPIHCAALHGNTDTVKLCTSQLKGDPCIQEVNGFTPLHFAAMNGHVEIIKYLITDCKCNPSQADNNIRAAPLHFVALNGSSDAVRFLTIEQHCDPYSRDREHDTPLHLAALKGKIDIVRFFIAELKCNPNTPGYSGKTPLHYAAEGGHVEIIKYLIADCKCDPSPIDSIRNTPLHYAALLGQLNVVRYLVLEQNCDASCKNVDNSYPLHFAAFNNNLSVVKFLISEAKCDPNCQRKGGITPLHATAEKGSVELVKYFIFDKGCDPLRRDATHKTLLHHAALMGNMDIVKFLIEEVECNLNTPGTNGLKLLHYAAQGGHVELMKYLINDCKCDPTQSDNPLLASPLHWAAMNGQLNVIRFLILEQGCDANCRAIDNMHPLHVAAGCGYLNVIEFLTLESNSNPNCKDISGSTPLHYAVENGYLNVVKFLIESSKCPPVVTNNVGYTPMMVAVKNGHHDIVEYFKLVFLAISGIKFYQKYFA